MLKRLNFLWAALTLCLASTAAAVEPEAAKAPTPITQDYEPRPALWLLEDPDTKIYMFGTVHMLPPGFKWRSPALDKAAADADELVVETTGAMEKEGSALARAFDLMMLDEPRPILKRVPKANRRQLKKAIAAAHVPIDAYDSIQTWAAAMVIGVAQVLGSYGADDSGEAPGVEDVLEAEFRKAGKPIGSVEDPVQVVASLNAIPESAQVELLLAGIGQMDEAALEESTDDNHLWAKGKYEALDLEDPKLLPPPVYEALVTKRNSAWTQWLEKRLERPGTVLFAVGAGHLAGKDSVQTMLAARGLAVSRVD